MVARAGMETETIIWTGREKKRRELNQKIKSFPVGPQLSGILILTPQETCKFYYKENQS